MPLTFTQNELLSPTDFIDRARTRGVSLRLGQLLELHRQGLLVPFFQLRRHRGRDGRTVPVAPLAANGHSQFRSHIALVTETAQPGCLRDPGVERFRSWLDGLRLPISNERTSQYPSVFYSPYQLLGLRQIEALCGEMAASRGPYGEPSFSLVRPQRKVVTEMDAGRRLAILLSALDPHYLPHIVLVAHHAIAWGARGPELRGN